jgi:hypothetical protein
VTTDGPSAGANRSTTVDNGDGSKHLAEFDLNAIDQWTL